MKALCIIGSPKSNGSTACVTDKIIEGMKVNLLKADLSDAEKLLEMQNI